MSFNRLNYDPCTYMHNLRQSVGSADYQIGAPTPHCQPCFATDPTTRLGTSGAAACAQRALVDVDSELRQLTRSATNCPTQKFLPDSGYCQPVQLPDCRTSPPAEDTRLSHPPCMLRGTGWNRWEWLCQDPQARVEVPFDFNISNRIIVKDNHRPCLPEPLDQSLALPPAVMSDAMVSYDPKECGKVANLLPSVNWRSCEEIARY